MTQSPSIQPPLESLSGRRFSFYPAIRNVEQNEWTLARETWSEILVVNAAKDLEVWVPRKYISGISSSDSPVLIVGLNRELQFQAGNVWPYREKVVTMPDRRPPSESGGAKETAPPPAPPRNSPSESSVGRLIAAALLTVVGVSIVTSSKDGMAPSRAFGNAPRSTRTFARFLPNGNGLPATPNAPTRSSPWTAPWSSTNSSGSSK